MPRITALILIAAIFLCVEIPPIAGTTAAATAACGAGPATATGSAAAA